MIIIINKRESLRMSDCVCVTYMFSKYHKHVSVSRGKLKPQWFKTKQKNPSYHRVVCNDCESSS